jgi:hypothetical protein
MAVRRSLERSADENDTLLLGCESNQISGDEGLRVLRGERFGSRLSALGSRLSAVGCRLSAVGCRLSALGR